jgi:hypothetical protein
MEVDTRFVEDWNVRREGPTVFLDLYAAGATVDDPPACSIAMSRYHADLMGGHLKQVFQESVVS